MIKGGIEWEQGSAVTNMVEAIRANDPDAMARAMGDYAAALGTRTTNILSGIVANVMIELHAARTERETSTRIIDHKLDLILLAHETTQRRMDAMEDATLARTLGGAERLQLIEMVRTIPALTERVAKLEAAHGTE